RQRAQHHANHEGADNRQHQHARGLQKRAKQQDEYPDDRESCRDLYETLVRRGVSFRFNRRLVGWLEHSGPRILPIQARNGPAKRRAGASLLTLLEIELPCLRVVPIVDVLAYLVLRDAVSFL